MCTEARILGHKQKGNCTVLFLEEDLPYPHVCTSKPASLRSLMSGSEPVMEYGLTSPITALVAAQSAWKPGESRSQATPFIAASENSISSLRGEKGRGTGRVTQME